MTALPGRAEEPRPRHGVFAKKNRCRDKQAGGSSWRRRDIRAGAGYSS